jgi:hypothetical protein
MRIETTYYPVGSTVEIPDNVATFDTTPSGRIVCTNKRATKKSLHGITGSFSDIPDDILIDIFEYIDLQTMIGTCRRACKKFKQMVDESEVYTNANKALDVLSDKYFDKKVTLLIPRCVGTHTVVAMFVVAELLKGKKLIYLGLTQESVLSFSLAIVKIAKCKAEGWDVESSSLNVIASDGSTHSVALVCIGRQLVVPDSDKRCGKMDSYVHGYVYCVTPEISDSEFGRCDTKIWDATRYTISDTSSLMTHEKAMSTFNFRMIRPMQTKDPTEDRPYRHVLVAPTLGNKVIVRGRDKSIVHKPNAQH